MLKTHFITAKDLPDLWFQAVYDILDHGRSFKIDHGSYAGQFRLEYDNFHGHVINPGFGSGTPAILPDIPDSYGIPNPVDFNYIYGGGEYERSYIEYLMTATKQPGEAYTYGERLTKTFLAFRETWEQCRSHDIYDVREIDGKALYLRNDMVYLNQIEWVIQTYKKYGHRNNQMCMAIEEPSDLTLVDPPCLRKIDTRIQDDTLHFFVYFQSWDLWGGLPANLAAIQALKEYMAAEIGVKDGEMIVESKGLHLYGYAEDLAKKRCLKEISDFRDMGGLSESVSKATGTGSRCSAKMESTGLRGSAFLWNTGAG